MQIKNAVYAQGAVKKEQYPESILPEIALFGRSNVGKSSLINCLINRKNLARTSAQPGKTQLINFYLCDESWYFVDLPGYGYAKVSVTERLRWQKMIEEYLLLPRGKRQIWQLIDIRHEPSGNDRAMYDWICHNGFTPIIIATKADKLKRSQIPKHLKVIRQTLGAGADVTILPFSAQTKQGREEIWDVIGQNIQQEEE